MSRSTGRPVGFQDPSSPPLSDCHLPVCRSWRHKPACQSQKGCWQGCSRRPRLPHKTTYARAGSAGAKAAGLGWQRQLGAGQRQELGTTDTHPSGGRRCSASRGRSWPSVARTWLADTGTAVPRARRGCGAAIARGCPTRILLCRPSLAGGPAAAATAAAAAAMETTLQPALQHASATSRQRQIQRCGPAEGSS